jgi:arylsulfatase A-like enzyme
MKRATLALLVACSACGESRDQRPNIVLISIDTLRADHLGCYGYARRTSPAIDALASEGVLFTDATSSTSWTLPAHATLFTGLPNSVHGCDEHTLHLGQERRTLAEALEEAGYRTAAFWSGPYLHPVFGLDQGFGEYVNCASFGFYEDQIPENVLEESRANQESHMDVTNPKVLDEVSKWLGTVGDARFFLFVHMWDVHSDYIPPPPYDAMFDPDYDGPVDGRNLRTLKRKPEPRDLQHLIALYDGEIAWTDHHVQGILDRLDELGLRDDTVIVLTADHGEEFFEHGRFGHRKALFQESVSVPLIVRYPGRISAGRREKTPVALADVAPTILDFARVHPLPGVSGRSLAPLLTRGSETKEEPLISELYRERQDDNLLAVRDGPWKLIAPRESNEPLGLWNLATDPREEQNLLDAEGSFERLQKMLGNATDRLDALTRLHGGSSPDSVELPPEVEKRLRDLGYVDGE